jgi:hypothetical protein
MTELENVIVGCFLALLSATDRDASDRAVETLFEFVADPRTPQYERKFYADLAESIEQLSAPAQLFEELASATVH